MNPQDRYQPRAWPAGTWIVLSLLLSGSGLASCAAEFYDLSVIVTTAAFGMLYVGARQSAETSWSAHPLRLAMPLFVGFQFVFWSRCWLTVHGVIGEPSEYLPYALNQVAPACCEYLLLHYPYFLCARLGYAKPYVQEADHDAPVDHLTACAVAVPILAVAVAGFLFLTYPQRSAQLDVLSLLAAYVATFSMRFTSFLWMLVTVVALSSVNRASRSLAWLIHGLSLAAGWVVVAVTGMRFLVLQPIASIVVVWLSLRRWSIRQVPRQALFAVFAFLLLSVVTDLKIGRSPQVLNGDFSQLSETLDRLVTRAASFHADAVLREFPGLQTLFTERREALIAELLAGLPFTGLVRGAIFRPAEPGFAMMFHWNIVQTSSQESSFFVSALTSIRYSLGLSFAVAASATFGLLYGFVARQSVRLRMREYWIVPQAMMLPVGLFGIPPGDLIRLLVNFWLFWVLTRWLRVRDRVEIVTGLAAAGPRLGRPSSRWGRPGAAGN